MTTSAFRHHDHVPPGISSRFYARLVREWVDLNRSERAAATVRGWSSLEPALSGSARPADIVDAIDAAPPAQKDETLLALIRLTQNGHQLAGRVILQAMLPKLGRLANRTSPNSSDDAWIEDRQHIAVAQMWHVIAAYPTERRLRKVAANLALDTLHRITEGSRAPAVVIPYDPAELGKIPGSVVDEPVLPGALADDADLPALLDWALERALVTREEAALLEFVYLHKGVGGTRSEEAAQRLGLTPAAIRQRCSRARGRLTAGVEADRVATLSV